MDRERYRRIKRLVMEADALTGVERAAFLEHACRGDDALRAEVERLLAPDDEWTDPEPPSAAPPGDEAPVAVPSEVGAYVVGPELGRGGMGVVHSGRDLRDDREVALKFVHPHLVAHTEVAARLRREVVAGRRVVHENVVQTLETVHCSHDGVEYEVLVTERVHGRHLRDLLRRLGRVPEALVREIAVQVAHGLAAIHGAGIVHRDIKPENVMLTDDQRVRIMDLGIAKLAHATAELTREGHFVGSLGYASPEQFESGDVGPASDLYSLGVLLYELLCGANPFHRDRVGAAVAAHLGDRPPPVVDRVPGVSPFLSALVSTLLERDAARRPASSAELVAILQDGEDGAWWRSVSGAVPAAPNTAPVVAVERTTALHGRDADVARLRSAWEFAHDGVGGALFVHGEPGIGKTRLFDAAARLADADGAHVLYAACPASGGLRGLLDALRSFFAPDVMSGLADLFEDDAPQIAPYAPLFDGDAEGLERVALPDEAVASLCCRVMRRLAATRPVLWIVDDVQNAPGPVRHALLAMVRSADTLPVLVLIGSRQPPQATQLPVGERGSGLEVHELQRLSAKAVVELLEEALHSETLADRLGARIARKSDGVPFFVFEMLRALRDDGTLQQDDDGSYFLSRTVTDVEVPSAIRDLVAVRLDELTRSERETLDVAAIVGTSFDSGLVAKVLGRSRVRVLQDLAELQRRRGIVRSEGRAHRFDHQQVLDVIYDELPEELRAEYHSLVADAIEASGSQDVVTLVHHRLRGTDPAAALPDVDRAVERLVASLRSEDAVEVLVLACKAPGVERTAREFDLHMRAVDLYDRLGRRDEQYASAMQALGVAEALGDDRRRARALSALGVHAHAAYDTAEATRQLALSLSLFESVGDERAAADTVRRLGSARMRERDLDAARELLEDARSRAAALGEAALEGLAVRSLGTLNAHQFRYDDALECARAAFDLLESAGALREAGAARALEGTCNWLAGRPTEAQAAYESCLAFAERTQDRHLQVNSRGRLGLVALHRGHLAEARRQFRHHREGGLEIGDSSGVGQALANLAQTASLLGDLPMALDCARRATQVGQVLDNARLASFGYAIAAAVHRYEGDAESAAEAVQQSLEWARAAGDRSAEGAAFVEMSEQARLAGDPAQALAHARTAEEIATELGSGSLLAVATLRLAELGAATADDVAPLYAKVEGGMAVFLKLAYLVVLWELTGTAAHLEAAGEILDHLVAGAPPECRVDLVRNHPVHRAVSEALAAR